MKSGRAALLILLALGVLSVPFTSEAQQAEKVARIGVLTGVRRDTDLTQGCTASLRRGRVATLFDYVIRPQHFLPPRGAYNEALCPQEAPRKEGPDGQHDGMIPAPEEARIAAVEVEAFLRAVVRKIMSKSLEELSPISLIEDEEAREGLREAEEHLQSERWEDACRELSPFTSALAGPSDESSRHLT